MMASGVDASENVVKVCISTTSIAELESISQDLTRRELIRKIVLDLAFRDVNLASSLQAFCKQRKAELGMHIDIAERCSQNISHAFEVYNDWDKFSRRPENTPAETKHQHFLKAVYDSYVEFTKDQEVVLKDSVHYISRITRSISKFPNLKCIIFTDQVGGVDLSAILKKWKEHTKLAWCLSPYSWCGGQDIGANAHPPASYLYSLASSLYDASISPESIELDLTVPFDLEILRPPIDEHDCQSLVGLVENTKNVSLTFRYWLQRGPHGVDQSRTPAELEALHIFTAALLSGENIEEINLDISGYPTQNTYLTWLGLAPPNPHWPRLGKLALRHLSLHLDDLKSIAENQSHTLYHLTLNSCILHRECNWVDAVDFLRDTMTNLEVALVTTPQGGEIGPFWYGSRRIDNVYNVKEVEDYVLKRTQLNPFLKWIDINFANM